MSCPICKQTVKATDAGFPFCSERCRTIDLVRWASGKYVISSPLPDISEDEIESEAADSHEKHRE
jgi:uncharacterized protein